jgi:hypothetical protein
MVIVSFSNKDLLRIINEETERTVFDKIKSINIIIENNKFRINFDVGVKENKNGKI